MNLSRAVLAELAALPESAWYEHPAAADGLSRRDEKRLRALAAETRALAGRAAWLRERRAAERAEARAQAEPVPLITSREQLFPPCSLPDCPRAGTPHACLLPHQVEGFEAAEPLIAMLGGYGAAKTVWAAALGVALSAQIPGNIGFVLRRSYPKLRDSVLRVYLDTLERAGVAYTASDVEKGMPHRVTLPNGSEIRFRESRDIGRLLSTECGWFHLEEAAEEPKATWGHLLGRLRLAVARRYLKGLVTSNPPHHQHWLAEVFGLTPGVTTRTDPETGQQLRTRLIQVSSRQNPHLPPGYVTALVTTHAAHDIKRLVDGQFGFVAEGDPVYPAFQPAKHVRDQAPLAGMTTVRAWDFGFRHPAVTWHQFPRCAAGRAHWMILAEYLGHDLEAEDLATLVVEQTKALLPPSPEGATSGALVDCADDAGRQRTDKGPGPLVRLGRAPWHLRFRSRHVKNVDPGLAVLRLALAEADCACGRPTVTVHRGCRHTIDALAGGYHYRDLKPGQQHTEGALKPRKDGFYDNIADSVRYAGENYYRGLRRDAGLLGPPEPPRAHLRVVDGGLDPWSWMDGVRRAG